MAKDLVALYEDLLLRCQGVLSLPDPNATRSKLYTLLLRRPLDPRLQGVLDEFGVSAGYARTHLLSIGSWPADVQEAMRAGLPYQDARKIAQLDDRARREVLRLFHDRGSGSSAGASLMARSRERELRHEAMARRSPVDRDGWVLPREKVEREPLPLPDTVVYREVDAAVGEEALPRSVLEGLVAAYTVPGGVVVDPMAGSGGTALAARALGRWSWSGDRMPRFAFIHEVDAADLEALRVALGARAEAVDLVVVHPPSVERWAGDTLDPLDAEYPSWIDRLVRTALALVRPSGHTAVVVRPWRRGGSVALLTDVVARAIGSSGGRVVGYHVLVEARGAGEWHVVVGRVPQ